MSPNAAKKPRPSGVPMYSQSNELMRHISIGHAEKLERQGLVVVVRRPARKDKRGNVIRPETIRRVTFLRPKNDARPIELSQYVGQRYSERESLPNTTRGKRPWRFKRLGRGNELRPIFLRVLTDCLVEAHA